MTSPARVAPRCASHPARLAADSCEVCGRPRCATDRRSFGASGCPLCTTASTGGRRPGRGEAALRSGLAALGTALAAGWVATQYVNVHLMSLLVPALLGLAVSWAAAAGTGAAVEGRRTTLAVAATAAVLGTALGFRLFGRPVTPVHPWHQVGPPYLAALVGVGLWPLLFPPRRRGEERQPAEEMRSKR